MESTSHLLSRTTSGDDDIQIKYKTPHDLYNLLQDSAITKILVDVRPIIKFNAKSIRNSIHLNMRGEKSDYTDEFTLEEIMNLKISDLAALNSAKYAWDDKSCLLKDTRDWLNRGLLFKNVILYDQIGKGGLVERIYKLLVSEGKASGVYILEGGIDAFEIEYPFLISSRDQKLRAVDGAFPSEIYHQFLFLGSYENVKNKKMLHSLGITHILNMADELENPYSPEEFIYKACGVNDTSKDDIRKHFNDAIDFIENARSSNSKNKVLVHCAMGISRSSAIVIAWIMKHNSWSFERSRDYVKMYRSCIKPNPGFVNQLKIFETEMPNGG